MAAQLTYFVGSHVWVEDTDQAWLDGEILESKDNEITVSFESGTKVVSKSANIYPKDPEFPPNGVEDMTRLAYLHEPGVLQNLQIRYTLNDIYVIDHISSYSCFVFSALTLTIVVTVCCMQTYTGNILIAVNPFQRLPHLYAADTMAKYKGVSFGEQSPHPFAIAGYAYRKMINEEKSQAILVSGESGAGKTESTKMLMHYLAYLGGRAATEGRSVEQQVLESNPVLEAFGNAKTVRNNNSSRFGKFVEIQFDRKGRISGAAIRTYLLERSRVCQVSDPERNYHCFYMLCAAPKEDVERFKLGNPRSFHYLNQSNCYELDALDDSKEYLATRRAMEVVGISADETDAIFRTVAAVLHLGNIEFVKAVDEGMDSSKPKDDKSYFHLKTAAELLMCDEKSLEDSFCKRLIVTRGEAITKCLDPNSAALSRDALAKIVYSRLFDWIVDKINNSIGQDPTSKNLIGVLDIYGFESFKTNSFEQFCINLTNEKLQQHFNQHVFKMEQEEYTKEEIDWSYIEFVDNQDVLDLIEKKPGGVIALLDEACMFPRSTHETFAEKLYQTLKDNKRFSKPKLSRTDFTINHYAGDVTYQTDLFLDKNKDYVVPEHAALLCASKCSFVSGLFPPLHEESTKSTKFSSIATQFKQQLQSLLETLSATEPHYIRCVKPNNLLKPGIFENNDVLQQLRCGGVMEAIRISCAGYPTRKNFDEFVQRFSILEPKVLKSCPDEMTACKRLIDKANLKGYQIGKTKVFLRAGQMAELDACRAEVLGRSAIVIQKKARTYICEKQYKLLRFSAIELQRAIKGQLARRRYECMRREAASLIIQKQIRMYLSRSAYKTTYSKAVCIQTGMRGMAARNELRFRKRTHAATVIQGYYRCYLAHTYFQRLKKATIAMQCSWRRTRARRELRKLKMAAKESKALEAAKIHLEKQVEELSECLETEKRMREAKTQENEKLQCALEEMELQFKETKSELIQEREAAKKLAEQVPTLLENNVANNELINKLTAENEQLKELVESLEKKTEQELSDNVTNNELVNKLTTENEQLKELVNSLEKKTKEEFPADSTENEVINKLTTENEQLKELVNSLEKKTKEEFPADFTENEVINKLTTENEQLKELVNSLEKKTKEELPASFTENEVINKLTTENEQLKELVNSLEKKTKEELPASFTENEVINKLTTENEQLKELVNSLEKKTKEELPSSFTENEVINKLTTENEQLKELVNSLEKKTKEEFPASFTDNEVINKLSEEKEHFKDQVSSLERKIDETEKKYEETSTISEERMNQIIETESKMIELKTNMQRLEEKLSDMETENQIFRKQTLLTSSSKRITPAAIPPLENGHPVAVKTLGSESVRRSHMERHQESVDALFKCVVKDIGFSDGKPVAAFTLYNCLLHWKSFEADKTSIFDRLIQLIGSAIEDQDNDNCMAYWLSNTSALFFHLQRCLRAPARKPPTPTGFFGRVTQGFRSSNSLSSGSFDVEHQVEAKYPALLFKQQLAAYVEKIYGIVRENMKKELSPLLSTCIEEQRTRNDDSQPSGSWLKIIECLDRFLKILKENYVPPILIQKVFNQTFQYINAEIFNSLLLHKECCTFNSGEYIKSGLAELELWCTEVTEEYAGSSLDELNHSKQAVRFLVSQEKDEISYDDLTNDICPVLSSQQLYRLCTLYSNENENENSKSVSTDVTTRIKLLMTDDVGEDDKSFLLEDNSSLPIIVEEVSHSQKDKTIPKVKPPSELLESASFQFLHDYS
ncbi:myosin-6 isoform X1 [Lathyrus oleraceus]|uniref:myosin-6 isoform X1 n=1 Tax=Pisum sativum TaxID=3888 RepID=UPI0021CE5BB2|nr:myosin-6-like isoform X1 [Pisum sativum]